MEIDYSSKIEKILKLERVHECTSFINGIESKEEAIDKYKLVSHLIDLYENEDEGTTDDERALLEKMILAHLVSPAAIACILADKIPVYEKALMRLEREFIGLDAKNLAIFQAIYFYLKHNMIAEEACDLSYELGVMQNIQKEYHEYYYKNSNNPFIGRGAVYTSITGDYDELVDPEYVDAGWDYYCFTDKILDYNSNVWKIIEMPTNLAENPHLMNRYAKTHPHILLDKYDYTIYVDGNITITDDLRMLINAYSKGKSMITFPHTSWNSIATEADAIVKLGKASPEVVMAQLAKYKKAGYADNRPLASAGCIIRLNRDLLLNKVMEEWYHEIRTMGSRDQMSLGYVCWKYDYYFDICELDIYNNQFIKVNSHI